MCSHFFSTHYLTSVLVKGCFDGPSLIAISVKREIRLFDSIFVLFWPLLITGNFTTFSSDVKYSYHKQVMSKVFSEN